MPRNNLNFIQPGSNSNTYNPHFQEALHNPTMVGLSGGSFSPHHASPHARPPYTTQIPQYYGGRKNAALKNFGNSILSGLKKTGKAIAPVAKETLKVVEREAGRAGIEALSGAIIASNPELAPLVLAFKGKATQALNNTTDRGIEKGFQAIGAGRHIPEYMVGGYRLPRVPADLATRVDLSSSTPRNLRPIGPGGIKPKVDYLSPSSLPQNLYVVGPGGVNPRSKGGKRRPKKAEELEGGIFERLQNLINSRDYQPGSTAAKIVEYKEVARKGLEETGHHKYMDEQNKKGKIQFGKGTKGGSRWISHVKQFAAQNGMTYKQAMSHPNCRSTY